MPARLRPLKANRRLDFALLISRNVPYFMQAFATGHRPMDESKGIDKWPYSSNMEGDDTRPEPADLDQVELPVNPGPS